MQSSQNNSAADELISAYLSGEITPESLAALQAWADASPENRRYFNQQRELWFAAVAADKSLVFDAGKAFTRFRNTVMKPAKSPRFVLFRNPAWRVAASVAVLVVVSLLFFRMGEQNLSRQLSLVTVEAPQGSRTRLLLNDGSVVWLNAGSSITYSQKFGVADRDIRIDGEGYFEVQKNEKLPFRVLTEDVQLTVLGTKFNFCNFAEDEEASITLLEGKVSFTATRDAEKLRYLNPDQRVVLNKKTGMLTISDVKANRAAEWTQGYLCFEDDLLPDITRRLERSYNVNIIIVDDTLDTYRFYGDFRRTELSVEKVLEMLSSTDKLTYQIKGKDIYLYAVDK